MVDVENIQKTLAARLQRERAARLHQERASIELAECAERYRGYNDAIRRVSEARNTPAYLDGYRRGTVARASSRGSSRHVEGGAR